MGSQKQRFDPAAGDVDRANMVGVWAGLACITVIAALAWLLRPEPALVILLALVLPYAVFEIGRGDVLRQVQQKLRAREERKALRVRIREKEKEIAQLDRVIEQAER